MKKINALVATGFGLGHLPMSGTISSAAIFLLWFLIFSPLETNAEVLLYFLLLGLTLWSTISYARQLQHRDAPEIVGDEIFASLLIIGSLPPIWYYYLIAFVLFRLFDIFKPLGIKKVEKFPGSWGIILDDVAAAIATTIITMIIISFV